MAGSPILSLLALVLVAGGLLLNIFIILSGTFINVRPINLIYFLSAGSGATQNTWTYFSLCTLSGGQNSACGSIHPAFPFDPSSQGVMNVPAGITSSHSFFYYMSRVSWSFYLIASFFAAVTLFSGIFACCTRIFSFLSGFNAFLAVASQAVCAALMTAWTVRARNAYQAAGQTADLGRYAYGFTWAAFACFFLAMILFCSSGGSKKKKNNTGEEEMQQDHHMQQDDHHMQQDHYAPPAQPMQQDHYVTQTQHVEPVVGAPIIVQPTPATGGFFNRHSQGKNRESGIKDEYS